MGEVVRFDKKQLALMQFVAHGWKKKCQELADAYEWAIDRQRERQLSAEPLRLTFSQGDRIVRTDDCILSVFYNPYTGGAILCEDWPGQMATKYWILVNFECLCEEAPNSLAEMLKNGLHLEETLATLGAF